MAPSGDEPGQDDATPERDDGVPEKNALTPEDDGGTAPDRRGPRRAWRDRLRRPRPFAGEPTPSAQRAHEAERARSGKSSAGKGATAGESTTGPDTGRPPGKVPPWLFKALLLTGFVVLGFVLAWWLFEQVRGLLVLLLLAQFLAFAMEPAVNWLVAHRWRRGAATGFVMLIVTLLLVGFGIAVGSLVVGQVSTLADRLPTYVDDAISWANDTFDLKLSTDQVQRQLTDPNGPVGEYAKRVASNAVGLSTTVLGVLFQLLTVLLFTFYLCADGPRLRRAICSILPPVRQREVLRAWEIAIDKTGGYIYSRLLLALVSGLAHYVLLLILGVPYALALAIWIGLVSQLVPTVGTYIAAALPLVVALVGEPVDAVVLLGFIVLYQQVENYFLQPRITARTLDIHPAIAFGAVIAGASILGGVGAVLAIPITAIIQTFVATYIRRYDVEEHPLTEPEPT